MAFAENYEYIQRENAKGLSYKLGLNEFSDMSMDEFKMSKLGMRMPESVWGNVPSGGVHKVSNASLPKSVDWRSKAVTPVKNQKQCGSCALPFWEKKGGGSKWVKLSNTIFFWSIGVSTSHSCWASGFFLDVNETFGKIGKGNQSTCTGTNIDLTLSPR